MYVCYIYVKVHLSHLLMHSVMYHFSHYHICMFDLGQFPVSVLIVFCIIYFILAGYTAGSAMASGLMGRCEAMAWVRGGAVRMG